MRRTVDLAVGVPWQRWIVECPNTGLRVEIRGLASGVRGALGFVVPALSTESQPARVVRLGGTPRANPAPRGDLLIVYDDRRRIATRPRHNAIVLPGVIHQVVWGAASGRSRAAPSKSDRQHGARQRRENRLNYTISTSEADFELFFHRMHQPMVRARFGEFGTSEPRDTAYHALFRRGFILFVRQDDRKVGGMLCHLDQRTGILRARLNGLLDGDDHWRQAGVLTAIHHFLIEYIDQRKLVGVDLSGSLPFISRGVYQTKCKFRPETVIAEVPSRHRRYWISPVTDTPAVRDFLVAHPVLVGPAPEGLETCYFHDAQRPPRRSLRSGTTRTRELALDEAFTFSHVP